MYGTQIIANSGSSSQGRRQRKQFNPAAFTRAGALKLLSATQDLHVCSAFEKHENRHVRQRAVNRANSIAAAEVVRIEKCTAPPVESVSVPVVADERFEALVARFTAEGKADPVKSAKASIAAQKAAETKRAARAVG